MTGELHELSAIDLIALYRAKKASPVEAAQSVLNRIEALQPTYNAFCVTDPERTLNDARQSEARWTKQQPAGLVDGVPTTIKDLMLSKGWPTLRGSKTVNPKQDWDQDAPIVARMRDHGAVFVGKTTTPEFGWKGVTDSPLTGTTRNPWDPERTPGGSSGGAAVAAALGMGTLNIGSDGGGSIRMPAGFCGIFGIKPTFGVVPPSPQSTMGSLSHHGPMTRTVTDAALMLTVISEPDPRDWYAGPYHMINYHEDLETGISGLRIAYSRSLGYATVDDHVSEVVEKSVHRFEELGAEIFEVDPGIEDPIEPMITLWSVGLALLIENTPVHKRALMDKPILELAEQGRAVGSIGVRRAEQAREALAVKINLFMEDYDLLITPQLPLTAFKAGNEVPPDRDMIRWWEWSPFTYPFNLTQHPAATVPCGLANDNLPVCLQIIAPRYSEHKLLKVCRAFENLQPFVMPEGA